MKEETLAPSIRPLLIPENESSFPTEAIFEFPGFIAFAQVLARQRLTRDGRVSTKKSHVEPAPPAIVPAPRPHRALLFTDFNTLASFGGASEFSRCCLTSTAEVNNTLTFCRAGANNSIIPSREIEQDGGCTPASGRREYKRGLSDFGYRELS